MEQIALIAGQSVFYWRPLLLTAGAITAILFFLSLYLHKPRSGLAAAFAVPMALVLSILLARLVHWYCRADSYADLTTAMTDHTAGGYALLGVFAGCIITALVLRLFRISGSAPAMLDCMSLAGGAGIAVGRLASFFDSSDRGPLLETLQELPWAFPVTNPVSGAVEYRLATFLIQAMAAAGIFLLLVLPYLILNRKGRMRDGDACLLFLLLYGASQVVLDSTRYDSLAFRSNGFVGVVQVAGAVGIVIAVLVFSVRLVRLRGFRVWYLGLWGLIAGSLGIAGYMEYYVQRHGSKAVFSYSVMSAGLGVVILTVIAIAALIPAPETKRRHGKFLKHAPRSIPGAEDSGMEAPLSSPDSKKEP